METKINYSVTFPDIEKTQNVVLTRLICSIISLVACLIIIVLYLFLWFKNNSISKAKQISNAEVNLNNSVNSSFQRSGSFSSGETNTKQKSIGFGLGSHAMFFLVFSNLLWCINSITSCALYPNGFLHILDNYLTLCPIHGFLHNYLDLCSIGWTTVISKLFLQSTKTAFYTQGDGRKQFIFGLIFSFGLPMLITLAPFYSSSYGPSGAYCSFNRLEFDEMTEIWSWVVQVYPVGCILYCTFAIVKVTNYYRGKLKLIKQSNREEYSVLQWYVFVFSLFPIFLSLSRLVKLINYGLEHVLKGEHNAMNHIYGVIYCLNGLFNSLLCLFFFRKGLDCCKKTERPGRNSINKYSELINKNDKSLNEDE